MSDSLEIDELDELGIEGIYPGDDDAWLPWLLSPAVAAVTGAGALAAGVAGWLTNAHRGPLVAAAVALLCAALVVLSAVDIKFMLLPDAITLPAVPVLCLLLAAAAVTGQITWLQLLTGLVCMAGCYGVLYVITVLTGGMAWGDLKLALALGLVLGIESPYAAALGALILPVLISTVLVLPMFFAGKAKARLPFGPFMAAGALLVLLAPGWLPSLWMGFAA